MDPAIWPRISPIWPSSQVFEHDVGTLHEEDDIRPVPVADARKLAEPPTLDSHGFALIESPCDLKDLEGDSQMQRYLEATAALVKAVSGAALVVPFNHVSIDTKLDRFGKRGGAVERVHGDYTQSSGPRMLKELGERGVLPASAAGKRGAILNVWRNASSVAVQQKPLAVLDTRTVAPDDLGLYYLVEGGDGIARRRMGQNLALRYSPQHAWFYYPLMTKDEALVFYTYDGREPDAPRFTFHAAFDPAEPSPDAPSRKAMIVRCAAFFD